MPHQFDHLIKQLLQSPEPSLRWKVRVNVLGEERQSPAIQALEQEIKSSARVQALLQKLESSKSDSEQNMSKELKAWYRQALLRSMETAGKTVVNIRKEFGKTVKAYWPNEDKWYTAKTVDKDPMDLSHPVSPL